MRSKHLLLMLLLALMAPWAANAQTRDTRTIDFETGNLTQFDDFNPINDETYPWTICNSSVGEGAFNHTDGGSYSIKSGNYQIGSSTSSISVTVKFNEAGSVSFWARVSSEQSNPSYDWDYGTFLIDGVQQGDRIVNSTSFNQISYNVEAGSHTFTWRYKKDGSVNNYDDCFYVDDIVFTGMYIPTCQEPTNLTATLTPGNGTIATLNWTENGAATNWVLEYGTASDFTNATSVDVSGTPTKKLTGLTAETKYYARVKADCGGGDESDWSATCEFTPTNALTITVADGTTTNGVIPLHSYSSDTQGSTGEFIIPASELASINGSDITNLTFYFSGTGYAWTNTFKVYMKEVTETTLSSVYGPDACTVVYTGTLDGSGATLEITLDDAYTYGGGNLLIGTYMQTSGSYLGSANFYGIEATGAAYAYGTYNHGNDGVKNFIPKTTLTYTAPPTCPKPTGLAYSNVDKRSVNLSWTEKGSAASWQICVNGNETNLVTANTNTNFLLEGLDPSTDYTVKVRAYCDASDQSEWSTPVNFTTLVACEEPTGFHAENITAFTADLKWTSTIGDYQVRYAPYTGTPELLQYDNGTLATAVGTGSATEFLWAVMYPAGSFTGNYLSKVTAFDCNSMTGSIYICQGGSTAPETLIATKAISFTDADDFVDFTFDQLVELDVTENLWIVFDNESAELYPAAACNSTEVNNHWISFDGSTWNDLADVGITGKGWMIRANIETISLTGTGTACTATTYPLTSLTPVTKYAAQVRNVCGGIDGESDWATTIFETLPSCTAPEGLAISGTVTARDAAFTWTAETDATFQYCVVANPTPGYTPANSEFTAQTTGNTATYTHALTPDTDYVFYLRKKCSDTDFSDIVSIAFQTDVTCHAPAALTVADVASYSATLNWTGESGDYDVRYGVYPTSTKQETLTYGLTQTSNLGNSTAAEITWGVKYPGSQITGNFLTGIVIPYVPSYNSNDYITLNVYIGGDNAPRNLVSTEVLHPEINGVNTLTLANPVALQAGENLWITLTETGTYVVPIAQTTEENTQWYFNGTEWTLLPYMVSNGYGCVIDGIMETLSVDAVTWTNATSTTGTYPISGLTAETHYMAQVRHNCGGEDGESIWWTTQFTTDVACHAPTGLAVSEITNHTAKLDWAGTSAGYNIDYRTAAYNDASGLNQSFTGLTSGIPNGWDNSEGTTTYNSYKWNYYNSGHDAAPCVRFDSYSNSSGNTNFLKTPAMNFPADKTMQLSFWWKNPTGGDFSVYISTDGGETKALLKGDMTSQSTWKQETITLPNDYVGASNVTIHFKGTSNYGNGDAYIYLDDITLGVKVAEGAWQHTTSTTNTKTIEGLLAETKYDVRVQGDCGSEGTSEWSDIVSFTTDIKCPAPSGLAYANLKSDHVDLSWTNGGSADWIVAYKADGETEFIEKPVATADVDIEGNTVTYTLTGLNEKTAYTVKVQDNCEASYAGDGLSQWTSEITFTTLEECAKPTDVTISNIGHYSADVTWTGDSDSFDVFVGHDEVAQTYLSEDFEEQSIPDDWTNESTKPWTVVEGNGGHCMKSGNAGVANSISEISFTYKLTEPAKIEFDALCMGEGTSTYWDHCDFYIDDTRKLYAGANISGWNHYSFDVEAGNHTFKWSYTKDNTTDPTGDYFAVDNISLIKINRVWNDPINVTVTECTITVPNAGAEYFVKVAPSCNAALVSEVVNFTTVSPNVKYFMTEGNWDNENNWEPTGVPTIEQDVVLKANATIESGVAYAKSIAGTGTGDNAKTLTIESGAKLKHLNSGVRATVKKTITGYGAGHENDKADYYLIANPLSYTTITTTSTPAISTTGLLTGNYDFYNWVYSASDGNEWRNYEKNAFNFDYGLYGYLYANEATTTLAFTGTINPYTGYWSRNLSASSSTTQDFPGWYLLGNPYMYDAYLANGSSSTATGLPYVKMNAAGDGFENVPAGTPIEPMTGFFYQATTSGSVYVVTTAPAVTDAGLLNMNLRSGNKQLDNAIVAFGSEQKLEKFSFRANSSKIYMPVEGKDYAITNAEAQGEMPVSFKAENNGSYTLSFSNENVEFGYLHLIDNMTGKDVNLLETPSYSFEAKTTDYASRFKLVFSTGNGVNEESFAFISDGNIILNGEGMLQVVDVMGRIMMQEENATHVSTSGMTPGVYVLRLINGDSVRTQKIVVK